MSNTARSGKDAMIRDSGNGKTEAAKGKARERKIKKQEEEFRSYLHNMERSENTIEAYMQGFREYFSLFDEITKENLIAYKAWLLERKKPKTVALRLTTMNVYCDAIGKHECRVKSIRVQESKTIDNVISMHEYQKFLQYALDIGNKRLYFILRFLASTGCRASELLKLEKSCLDTGKFSMMTKGKIRTVYIPKALIKESKEYFATVDSKYLFPNRYGEQMSKSGLDHLIRNHGQKCGIRPEVLHCHSFRHLFAIQFLKRNKNLALLSDLMGHENVNTTAIYLRMSSGEQYRVFNRTVNW